MLWPVLMFWSLVIVALILFCLGFWLKRASPAFVGAVIATPFCLLVSGYGFPFWLGGPIALASIFGSAGLLKGIHLRAHLGNTRAAISQTPSSAVSPVFTSTARRAGPAPVGAAESRGTAGSRCRPDDMRRTLAG